MTTTQPACIACGRSRRAGDSGAHGWCNACTKRWYRAGRPDTGPPPSYAVRCEDYDWLRAQGHDPAEVAARLGMPLRTARRHEERRAAAGLPSAPVPNPVYMRPCGNCGEVRRHGGHGWCATCYGRWWRAGSPDDAGPPPPDEVERRRAHSERATRQHALDTAIRAGGWGWAA